VRSAFFRTVATFANRLQKIKLITNFTNVIIALFLHLITTVSFNNGNNEEERIEGKREKEATFLQFKFRRR